MVDKVRFDFDTLKWDNLSIEQVKFFEKCYPDIDVVTILADRMPAWLISNPKKAQKKNWVRFINNWLSREQSRFDEIKFKGGNYGR